MTRDGKKAIVTGHAPADAEHAFPLYNDDTGTSYTLNGRYYGNTTDDPRDLIGPWPKKPEPAPEPAPEHEPTPTFGVGEWVTRDGRKVTIKQHVDKSYTYPLMADDGKTFTLSGRYGSDKALHPLDLVGPWVEPKPIPELVSMIKTTTKREFIDGEYMGMEIKNVRNRKAVIDDIIWSSDYLRKQASLFNLLADIADENAS
jgi:hypothetical protein